MPIRKLEKRAVLTRCLGMLNRQLRFTQHPRLRRVIEEAIDYLGAVGRADEYDLIVTDEAVVLIHRQYEKRPNLKLLPDGTLVVGRFDEWLEFNDAACLILEPRGVGTAECGACRHGIPTGERITEQLILRDGREVTDRYPNRPLPDYLRDDVAVDNDYARPFVGRLLHNRTIGRRDFIYGVGLLLAAFYGWSALVRLALPGGGAVATGLVAAAAIAFFGGYILLIYKRVADLGLLGAPRGAAIMIVLLFPVAFVVLMLLKTRITAHPRHAAVQQRRQELRAAAQRRLACRCAASEFVPEWY